MQAKSIGQLAKKAGVSIRTLRHYDEVGLLSPSHRADNGYRFYSASDSQRLHDILFYRALGFSLSEIKKLLSTSPADRYQHLLWQRDQLKAHMSRLERMQIQLDTALQAHRNSRADKVKSESKIMQKQNEFDVFDGFDPDQYAAEAEEKWGDTDAYKESAKRANSYSDEDWQRYKAELHALNQEMVTLMNDAVQADSEQAQQLAEEMRLQIDHWFYPCSRTMHAQLGEMYVADERFTATYDKISPGLAEYIRDAAQANLENNK